MEFSETPCLSAKKALYIELMLQLACYLAMSVYEVKWEMLSVVICAYYVDAKVKNFVVVCVLTTASTVFDLITLSCMPQDWQVYTPGHAFTYGLFMVVLILKFLILGTIYLYEKEDGESSGWPRFAVGRAIAAISVVVGFGVGLGVYAAYKIADILYIDGEERERFECDCTWISSWVCPSNERAASLENLAENDGSLCYNYCCEKVEAMMHAAKDIIQERDDRADKVDIAMKLHLQAEVAARKDTTAFVSAAAVIGLGLTFGAIWLVKRRGPLAGTPMPMV